MEKETLVQAIARTQALGEEAQYEILAAFWARKKGQTLSAAAPIARNAGQAPGPVMPPQPATVYED